MRTAAGQEPLDDSALALARALILSEPLSEPVVVLLDGVSGAAGHELFGRLRDLVWQTPIRWVVATRDRSILTPPADSFFDQQITLGPMRPGAIARLIHLRLDEGTNSWFPVDDAAAASEGNPRRALEITREAVFHHRTVDDLIAEKGEREAAVSRLGRAPSMLLAEMQQLARPVWSSDEELLGRMGWTRNRAVQVLGELEAAGFVVSYRDRGPAGGTVKMFIPNIDWVAR